MVVTAETSHLDRSPLNLDARENVLAMLVTADTSHLDRSWSNLDVFENILNMLLTADTSQFPIGPCGPLGQSPIGDTLRHCVAAVIGQG